MPLAAVCLLYKGLAADGQTDATKTCMMAHLNSDAAVLVWVVVVAAFTTTVMSQTTLIPSIPASQEDSSLANLWRHALRGQVARSDKPGPKTFLAPEFGEVINWVPQDSAHPLYTSTYADLLQEILLDNMVQEEVKPDDPTMSQPNGLQVTNLNGKTLTFTRDASGIKVNGVEVTNYETNADGTVSYTVSESLFGHRQKVHDAWKEHIKTAPVYDSAGRPIHGPNSPPSPADT